jgi:ribosomal protein S18 acetylase RimI-like enzyme
VHPWNEPERDFLQAIATPTSTVLGVESDGELVGTVMVGFDGHRGWLYYVAVAESFRSQDVGTALVSAAEEWLSARGARKSQLMVRHRNVGARDFYAKIGYEPSDVTVLQKWLSKSDS